MIYLKIIGIILLADFLTGLFHFYADNYGVMDSKYLTVSINGLLIHHEFPNLMTEQSYWDLTKGVYKVGGAIFLVSLFFGFHWEILLFVLISSQANIIHKWSHQKRSKNPQFVRFLQTLRIIQTKKNHMKHHNGRYDNYYCVMTNVLNPILKKIMFWEGVIKFLKLFHIEPVQRNISNNKLMAHE